MVINSKSFLGYILLAFGIGTVPYTISTFVEKMWGGVVVMTITSLILIILGSYLISSK